MDRRITIWRIVKVVVGVLIVLFGSLKGAVETIPGWVSPLNISLVQAIVILIGVIILASIAFPPVQNWKRSRRLSAAPEPPSIVIEDSSRTTIEDSDVVGRIDILRSKLTILKRVRLRRALQSKKGRRKGGSETQTN
jgi:hypothetical protein